MPAFDMDQARVKTIKKLQKKLAKYKEIEIEKMVEEKWDEATQKIASQLATALAENEKLKKQKTKKIPEGFVMIEEKSFDKVAKDLMKVSEENKKLKKKNEQWAEVVNTATAKIQRKYEELEAENEKLQEENEAKEKKMKTLVEYSNSLTVQANADNDSLKEENEKLKEELDKANDERYKMCQIANANGWDIYPTDSEEEEEEDKPDRCVSCDKTFDLSYTMRHADKETKQKYDEYFGSEDDGGDLCTECLNK